MSLQIKPLHPVFVAEISGVDLRKVPTPEEVEAIVKAIDQYAVVVFRNEEPITQDQQMAFTRAFGPLDLGFKRVSNRHTRLQYHELADISNVGENNEVVDLNHFRILNNMANQMWHADSSFQKPGARYSMLHSVINPSKGGETEFADMRHAYDTLPEDLKQEIEGLEAEHFVFHSRFLLGDTGYSETQVSALPPVRWPIVRTHPGSGRKHLFIGAHAREVIGLPTPVGRMLLSDLLEHATQRENVYRHEWRVGDLVIWDNRCTLHRGRRYNLSERRELRRSTTLDVDYDPAAQPELEASAAG